MRGRQGKDAEDCPTRETVLQWIVAHQLGRRNLTPSQKGVLALEIEKQLAAEVKKRMSEGGRRKGVEMFPPLERSKARDKAAEMVGANPHYVIDAKKIERGAPEILDHVKQESSRFPKPSAWRRYQSRSGLRPLSVYARTSPPKQKAA